MDILPEPDASPLTMPSHDREEMYGADLCQCALAASKTGTVSLQGCLLYRTLGSRDWSVFGL